ncbi:MAG: LLM class F420-dependent oxidoreductase [Dehalococcoidia bacterium]|nr:LLM class F420-dependent oxidoreductase [Dehalococcoidia bacterium]
MDLGITIHLTDWCIDIRELAIEAEARGFSSVFIPEHSHIPSSQKTPVPAVSGIASEDYPRLPDPLVSLAAAASVTTKIRLGTGVLLVAQHNPINLAKGTSTLDTISDGRFEMGVGYGWNREEMLHHGVDFSTRRERVRETMLAVKELWTKEEAEFHGEFVDFESSWMWPKPVQKNGPRIMLGGAPGPTIFNHIAEFGNGWMPIGGSGVKASLPELKKICESKDRDFSEISIVPFGTVPEKEKLNYFEELGVNEVILRVPAGTREEVLKTLDSYREFF